MNESRTLTSSLRRVTIPLIVVAVLVVSTILISGSALIRIEDVTLNRILAGTYGTPDWRVQEMNPLLAQFLTLLYRIIPAVNWYGGLLLLLLLISAAAGISLAARKSGGLLPAIIVASPIIILLTNSIVSTAVCALAGAVGALSIMDGFQRKKDGIARVILGIVLFAFSAMLSIQWAIVMGIGAVLCWLPRALRDERVRGLIIGLLVMAVAVAALFGYSALMYNSPELSAYRNNYALYERLQHSSLKEESESLLNEYGIDFYSEDHADHDHDGDGVPDGIAHTHEDDLIIRPNSFDTVDWLINDANLFFTRYSSDSKLTDPEVLSVLEGEASFWDFTPSRLFSELFTTIKKPQFLLLIALFAVSALAVLITSRRRGLIVVLAALIAFGGHVLSIAHYYDTFADIAPFYLLAISVMLYFFDGEDAKAWYKRILTAPGLRIALNALVLVIFVGVLGGLLYYTNKTPANPSQFTVEAVNLLKPAMAENPDMLYIGENPNERFKPQTLSVPVRSEDENLLAGSYDLYSPRRAALMAKYEISNPLPDSVGREDIAYVLMGFPEAFQLRLITAYGLYPSDYTIVAEFPGYSEMILHLNAYNEEEAAAYLELEAQKQAELDAILEQFLITDEEEAALHVHEEGEEDHDHEAEEDHDHDHPEDTGATGSPAPSATPNG